MAVKRGEEERLGGSEGQERKERLGGGKKVRREHEYRLSNVEKGRRAAQQR